MTAPTYPNDDARWAALRAKDRAAEGAFYIGVRTTGVYCVASCGGRPLRKNVDFHATREAARAAGLRACLRCQPDVDRETLRWAVTGTSLGLALVARSEAGLRLVILGDDVEALRADLEARFKRARIVLDAEGLTAELTAVADLIDHPDRRLALPLDTRGTELQQAVWAALRQIPAGRTASYADIAKAVGRPGAFRAVAQACGANPLAVITPCHRVVRADGSLSGYRWGVERKRALLAREAA
ncbi:methylated-DNA--[protein]-cysteine S-methyltransferase [Caulobacter vibrioides]|jgi:AraC family transcriptional regulator of adaptative response/methylated-DNA-[protein]-cysteine methyltransferase|uniref:methylated-DNA--[protein]-cysteine S-methyltransferase n=1 Tax=Caulobacter vibrioides OR37 TaxID=1292034 RepID=R0EPW5_CAUVI|nr:methylated-DNA--[protein]-cysteine S-methyltransferase [Caulobacter vibrioides]ENZ83087.1 O-6-methylguanine DNA methyltransferase [Caulobacter vibrioides OR37]